MSEGSSVMKQRSTTISRHSMFLGSCVALAGGLITLGLLLHRTYAEFRDGSEDLTRRAQVLSHRIAGPARIALEGYSGDWPGVFGDRLNGHSRLLGIGVVRNDGTVLAAGEGLDVSQATPTAMDAMQGTSHPQTRIVRGKETVHILASSIRDSGSRSLGAVVVLHDAEYLYQRRSSGILYASLLGVLTCIGLFFLGTGLAWAIFERPMLRLAEWMRRLRFANAMERPPSNLPVARLFDETNHLAASFRAARATEHQTARDTVRLDNTWSKDRLRAHAIDALAGEPLIVVSNREPYMHQMRGGVPALTRPASGLVTGLDPVLRACGGLWVAHGAGDADRQTADNHGCVAVPPEDPRYTLRRVWLSKDEEQGYYYGFSNEGLWPLCHLTHERPVFRQDDWEQYVRVNQRFADAVLEEIGNERAVVLVQDYQLALVPGMIKARRSDLRVGLFWHIPWPNPEAFRICPYRREILKGMLGADLIGFHLQQHCNNFLDTTDRMIEARLDWDRFAAELGGHTAVVRPFPISVQPWSEREVTTGVALDVELERIRQQHQLVGVKIGIGVDRIDYTKGIAERFRAIERFFEKYPDQRGKWTFVQLGAPSRTHIPRYRDLVSELETLADTINWKLQTDVWRPICLLVGHHDEATVFAFMRISHMCLVSSLHDGMNLVAKEYVAASADVVPDAYSHINSAVEGVLVLSEFAGAARDLPEALIVNPYATDEFADAIHAAAVMPLAERKRRMLAMRMRTEENSIYRWAASLISALAETKRVLKNDT